MDAAKDHCQGQAVRELEWYPGVDSAALEWRDHPNWSYGFLPVGKTRIEWSILVMGVHGQEKND